MAITTRQEAQAFLDATCKGEPDNLPGYECEDEMVKTALVLVNRLADVSAWEIKHTNGQTAKMALAGSSSNGKLKWAQFDPAKLSAEAKKRYDAYRAANVAAAKSRDEFEKIGIPEIKSAVASELAKAGKAIPAGRDVIVTYNYGKLNIAIGEPKKSATSAKGFSDLL